jgi:hypothetical protein
MRGQQFADFLDSFEDGVAKLLVLKMCPHSTYNVLPELFAALFVNRFVANNGEFVRSWRYENQHRIALAGLVHSETLKLFLCNDQRIDIELSALNINTNLAGSFRFGISNRLDNAVMLKLAKKFPGSHFATNSILRLRRRNSRLHR